MIGFEQYNGIEKLGSSEVRSVQEKLLKKQLEHIASNSPFYRNMFQQEEIKVEKLSLMDLSKLPLTDKTDLEKYNHDFLAVPFTKVADIVLSSGTTGKPTKMMYTNNDLSRLAYNEKVAFTRIGITTEDIVLLTCTMDRCFIAGLAYYSGALAVGAATVRNGLNTFESHVEIIKNMSPTVIVGVPSFLYKMALFLNENGIESNRISVNKLICIGEPIRDKNLSLRKRGSDLEQLWDGKVFSTYASSEIVTTACECYSQCGGHLHPALAIVEIIDDDGNVLPPGEVGEVVMTPLMVEGMPLLRFKTGDISFLIDDPCSCGRTSSRLGPVLGRKKQMIKFYGTTLYPQAIYSVLDEIPEVSAYYVVVSRDSELSDIVKVFVSLRNGSYHRESISEKLQARLRVKPEVVVSSGEEIRKVIFSNKSRKPVRFIDKRGD